MSEVCSRRQSRGQMAVHVECLGRKRGTDQWKAPRVRGRPPLTRLAESGLWLAGCGANPSHQRHGAPAARPSGLRKADNAALSFAPKWGAHGAWRTWRRLDSAASTALPPKAGDAGNGYLALAHRPEVICGNAVPLGRRWVQSERREPDAWDSRDLRVLVTTSRLQRLARRILSVRPNSPCAPGWSG